MTWIKLRLDVEVNTPSGKKGIINAIRKGIYKGLDDKGISALGVRVSFDFRDKDQLFYMVTDLGKEALVTLFYEESGTLKKTGHEFTMHSYMLGTEQGCGYIDYEIRLRLEKANEQGMYHDSWAEVYESFEDLPIVEQIKVAECLENCTTVDEMILALDKIGIAADPCLDNSVVLFRYKIK